MIVVDTQLLIYLTTEGANRPMAERVLRVDATWVTVPLWRSEFRNVLAGALRRGEVHVRASLVSFQRAAEVLESEIPPDTERVMQLAAASRCTAYDLEFVALADELDVKLVTNDRELLAAFPDRAVSPAAFVS